MAPTITYAVGDVHGRCDLLEAVVSHAEQDAVSKGASPRFVFIGDICDRGYRSRQAYDFVAEVLENHTGSVLVKGNHDDLFCRAIKDKDEPSMSVWLMNGGIETLDSYCPGDTEGAVEVVRTMHADHLRMVDAASHYLEDDKILYVHAGISPLKAIQDQNTHDLMWTRTEFLGHVGPLSHVVVHGHTVVGDLPVVTENRVSIDTGAYHSGRLTVAAVQEGKFSFFQTDGNAKKIVHVDPVFEDRGLGSCIAH